MYKKLLQLRRKLSKDYFLNNCNSFADDKCLTKLQQKNYDQSTWSVTFYNSIFKLYFLIYIGHITTVGVLHVEFVYICFRLYKYAVMVNVSKQRGNSWVNQRRSWESFK